MIQTAFNLLGINKISKKACVFTLNDSTDSSILLQPSKLQIDGKDNEFKILANDKIQINVSPKNSFTLYIEVTNYVNSDVFTYTYLTLNNQTISLKPLIKECTLSITNTDTSEAVIPSKIYVNDLETEFETAGDNKIKFDVPYDEEFKLKVVADGYLNYETTTTYQLINNQTIKITSSVRSAKFTVVDNNQRTTKFTTFKLKYNGIDTAYIVNSDNSISLDVPAVDEFTIQIYNVTGYVDSPVMTLTYVTLNGKQITLDAISEDTKAVFNCTWTSEGTSVYDFDTHMQIKSGTENKGHVYYSSKKWSDDTTTIELNVDARSSTLPPETISVTKINDNYTYYYYVNDYSKQGKFETSNLGLAITLNNKAVEPVFQVPTGAGAYYYWNVCAIKNGKLYRAEDYLTSTVSTSANTTWADAL